MVLETLIVLGPSASLLTWVVWLKRRRNRIVQVCGPGCKHCERPIMIEADTVDETFCTCPGCYLLGTHKIIKVVQVLTRTAARQLVTKDEYIAQARNDLIRSLAGADPETVTIEGESQGDYSYTIGTWQNPALKEITAKREPGTYVTRECWMCTYHWTRHYA